MYVHVAVKYRRFPPWSEKIYCLVRHVFYDHTYHVRTRRFDPLHKGLDPSTIKYWEDYGNETDTVEHLELDDDEEKTGVCFQGRSACRPSVIFDVPESAQCTKKYTRSETHSNGIITLQCSCENPKLLGFLVMRKPESTALALSTVILLTTQVLPALVAWSESVVLTHFKLPPHHVFHDNYCHLPSSAMIRVQWLLYMTRFIVDRFHYVAHKCSSFFDRTAYPCLDTHRTTSADSFNDRLKKVLLFISCATSKVWTTFLLFSYDLPCCMLQ